ncbi:MAG: undecaprenyl-diphosphate phosphatase [Betaproteobacteria bacterium]|nr:undecaprenyl-diphosphate phosphatase [Betaproteobacteria bacterium]
MDVLIALPLLIKGALLGIVEGLTEFLPVSSTGHLILVGHLLGFADERAKVFEIVIQSGAMFAVLWYFRARVISVLSGLGRAGPTGQSSRQFVIHLALAFLPAAVLGLAFGSAIKRSLFAPVPVALAFIVGGLVILWVERRQAARLAAGQGGPRVLSMDGMDWRDALKLGVAQAFALIPGTSRSGATIIGGMLFGLSRQAATEFSFFLAMPTLMAAGAYDLWKARALLSFADLPLFAVGLGFSFLSALACVHWLIRFVASHTFTVFAWYRIGFGALVLATAWSGSIGWTL